MRFSFSATLFAVKLQFVGVFIVNVSDILWTSFNYILVCVHCGANKHKLGEIMVDDALRIIKPIFI